MHGVMTFNTRPRHKKSTGVGPGKSTSRIIGVAMKAGKIMTILAQHMNPFRKEIFMIAAMRCMADEAVLLCRRMYPDKRAPLVGMAGKAEQIHRLCVDHSL